MDKQEFVKLYNPSTAPFGQLSNYYIQQIDYDGEKWQTPAEYIRQESGKPISPLELADLRKQEKKKMFDNGLSLYDKFSGYRIMEFFELYTTAIKTAYLQKLSENGELKEQLMLTYPKPIYFISENIYFGVDDEEKKNGYNLIGVVLSELRNYFISQIQTEEKLKEEKELMKFANKYYNLTKNTELLSSVKIQVIPVVGPPNSLKAVETRSREQTKKKSKNRRVPILTTPNNATGSFGLRVQIYDRTGFVTQ